MFEQKLLDKSPEVFFFINPYYTLYMSDSVKYPSLGYYYHYKHDPKGKINNYAYEVIGTGMNTETREYSVIYRPLYKNTFLNDANYCVRPLEMFMGTVLKEGVEVKRFTKITDEQIILQLINM